MKGKLKRGGDPDLETVAKQMINDYQRGQLNYFELPPIEDQPVLEEDLVKEQQKDKKQLE